MNYGPSQAYKRKRPSRDDYSIAIIVPLAVELVPVRSMLDSIHDDLPAMRTYNCYTLGEIGQHMVVIATLPTTGNNEAGAVATQLLNDFLNIRLGLLVGVGGGVPGVADIRLGDIVVSESVDSNGAVIQLDRGKKLGPESFQWTGHLNNPHNALAAAVKNLRAQHAQRKSQIGHLVTDMMRRYPAMETEYKMPDLSTDRLFEATYEHRGQDCSACDGEMVVKRTPRVDRHPRIHYGPVGSSNALIRSGTEREKLRQRFNILSVEMEAAGLMNVLPCLVIRGICDYADSHKNKEWQPYAAANAAAYMKELLSVVAPIQTATSHSGVVDNSLLDKFSEKLMRLKDPKFVENALFESLAFDRMDARLHNIEDAHPQTCKWLFLDKCFRTWMERRDLQANNGLFWIKGKPGSGKSTVMKTALERLQADQHHEVLISYFFNARAPGPLEKSSIGLYRSLTYQILDTYPTIKKVFMERFRSKYRVSNFLSDVRNDGVGYEIDDWSEIELKNFLSSALKFLKHSAINIFIDALDEGEENDIRNLVTFLENFALRAMENIVLLRICFSSRHFPQIRIRKALSLVLEHHPGHRADIKNYVYDQLDEVDDGHGDLRLRVCEKSAMVFLWVVLVIPVLRRAYDRGRVAEMSRCLEELPQDLETLFDEIMSRDQTDIDQCFKLLHIVLFARRPLTQAELYIAIQLYDTNETFALDEVPPAIVLDRYIVDISRGFVELTRLNPPTVQFVHELVRTFLRQRVYQWMKVDQPASWQGTCHDALKLICLRYIQCSTSKTPTGCGEPESNTLSTILTNSTSGSGQSFVSYVAHHLFLHADLAGWQGIKQDKFIRDFITATYGNKQASRLLEAMSISYDRDYLPEYTLLLKFVHLDCSHLLRGIAETLPVNSESSTCLNLAIFNASGRGLKRSLQVLVDIGPRFGVRSEVYHSALASCSQEMREEFGKIIKIRARREPEIEG